MNIAFTFRNLDSSDALKSYATEKVAKVQKYLRTAIDASVTLSTERHLHCVDVSVVAGPKRFSAQEESEDMYASIDLAMDKIDGQVRREKEAATAKRRRTPGGATATKKA